MQTIEGLEALREQKQERMEAINTAAADEGRTKGEDEREEYSTLRDDIAAIDLEIKDLKDLEAIAKRAVPISGKDTKDAGDSRSTSVTVKHPAKPEPGIQFARLAMCLAKAKGNPLVAHNLLMRHYPNHPAVPGVKLAGEMGEDYGSFIMKAAELRTKAAVDGGTTATGSWGNALLAHDTFGGDFIEYLRARTIIGQMGMGNVPGFRRIPFNVHIKGASSGSTGGWVGEGQPKPVTKGVYTDAYHGFKKAAAISVLSDELIRFSDPAAEALVRNDLADAVTAVFDGTIADATAVSTGRPAGLLNGVVAGVASGVDYAALKADLKTLWTAAIAANLPIGSAVYWTTPAIAQSLSLMSGTLSDMPLFPDMSVSGGTLLGTPVITSNHITAGYFILVFASEVYLSQDPTVSLDASMEATIEMESAPEGSISDLDGSTPAPVDIKTGAAFVSMFQTNSVALRAEQYLNWSKRRATAVAYLSDVDWGGEASS